MSAYIVDDETINVIVAALKSSNDPGPSYPRKLPDIRYIDNGYLKDFVAAEAESMGNVLREMNANAVHQRYPGENANTLPGPWDWDSDSNCNPQYVYTCLRFYIPSATSVYKSLQSYLYQCCEGDVDELPLYKGLRAYQNALACHIVENTDAYEKAQWG